MRSLVNQVLLRTDRLGLTERVLKACWFTALAGFRIGCTLRKPPEQSMRFRGGDTGRSQTQS